MVLRNPVEVWQNVLVFDPGVAGIWALEVHIEDMASVFPKADYVRLEFYAAAKGRVSRRFRRAQLHRSALRHC